MASVHSTSAPEDTRQSTLAAFVSYWPSLPFLAFGVMLGWNLLIYSGATWLSDSEVNGRSLSNLYLYSTAAMAVVFLLAAYLLSARGANLDGNRWVVLGGVLCSVGSLAIVLAGPYYLNAPTIVRRLLFRIAAVVLGGGAGLISLRCALLYGRLSPRRTIIYVSLSHFVGIFIYMLTLICPQWAPIPHGPSLTGTLVLTVLPLVAASMACIEPAADSGIVQHKSAPRVGAQHLPRAFWGLMLSVFALSFVASVIRSNVVSTHDLAVIISGNNICTVLLVGFSLVMMFFAVSPATSAHTLGRTCSIIAIVAATITACAAAVGNITNSMSILIYFCRHVFDSLIWCILAFIAVQRHVHPATVFGIGRGLFLFGCFLGWVVGTLVLPQVTQDNATSVFFLVLAGIIMVFTLCTSARRDYDTLFTPKDESDPSMEDLFDLERRAAQLEELERQGKRGRFSRSIELLVERHRLSVREAEALRYLAMGYGNDRIAESMQCKSNTARTHTRNVYQKLGVHTREQLMRLVDETMET